MRPFIAAFTIVLLGLSLPAFSADNTKPGFHFQPTLLPPVGLKFVQLMSESGVFTSIASTTAGALSSKTKVYDISGRQEVPGRDLIAWMGSCVPAGDRACAASIRVWDTPQGEHVFISAHRFLDEHAPKPRSTMTHLLNYPKSAGSEPSVECFISDQSQSNVLGLMRPQGQIEGRHAVSHAWRLSVETGKFVPLDASSVTCAYPLH